MTFDFQGFFRFAARLLGNMGDRGFGWTPKRAAVSLALYLFYSPFKLVTWVHPLLDELLFPDHRRIEVRAPVFIVSNFRGGTTFLHRLLALDRDRFCTMQMWEVLLAPPSSSSRPCTA